MSLPFTGFVADEGGASAAEYGLIAGLIAVAIIVALLAFRDGTLQLFNQVADGVNTVASP